MSTPVDTDLTAHWADLHEDLLNGIPSGWKDGRAQPLDPGRLVRHFRKLPVRRSRSGQWLLPNGKQVHENAVYLLYVALAERGWTISRKAARDALSLVLHCKPPR
jgi:hypothetical protein